VVGGAFVSINQRREAPCRARLGEGLSLPPGRGRARCSAPLFSGWKWLVLAVLPFFAATARSQVTGSIASFSITNYTGYVLAGDTNSGGRQAIRTSTAIFFTNTSSTSQTYDFQLAYQLLNGSNQPVPVLDENGLSNLVYSVYETNTLPETFRFPPFPPFTITSYYLTNAAPLQPLARLDPYQDYTASLMIYSRPHTNGSFAYTGANASYGGFTFYDFTNTVSPDPSPNLLVTLDYATLDRNWIISNSPAQGGFPVAAGVTIQRYDDWTLAPYPTNTTVALNFRLVNTANGASIPLLTTQAVFNVSIDSTDGSSPPNPAGLFYGTNFSLVPLSQLDSVDGQYQVVVPSPAGNQFYRLALN